MYCNRCCRTWSTAPTSPTPSKRSQISHFKMVYFLRVLQNMIHFSKLSIPIKALTNLPYKMVYCVQMLHPTSTVLPKRSQISHYCVQVLQNMANAPICLCPNQSAHKSVLLCPGAAEYGPLLRPKRSQISHCCVLQNMENRYDLSNPFKALTNFLLLRPLQYH
jgi:hypothetical protein